MNTSDNSEDDLEKRINSSESSFIVNPVFRNSKGVANVIDEELLTFLKDKGYTLEKDIGKNQGHTQRVFLATYRSGDLIQKRVIKIPLYYIDSRSITTVINLSKSKDAYAHTAKISNELKDNDHIVQYFEHLKYKGVDILAEEYSENAESLQTHVERWGKLSNDAFMNIVEKYLDAVEFLLSKGILHRDHKPSNILVNPQGKVKLTDLMNCKRIQDINANYLPTRGGTPYTHPSLINSVMSDKEAMTTIRTEIYSIVATMYYALKGEPPIEYTLAADKSGKETIVDGQTYFLILLMNGIKIDKVGYHIHQDALEDALTKIPRKYRKMIERGLTLDPKKCYNDIGELVADFRKLKKTTLGDIGRRMYDATPTAVKIAIPAAVFGGFVYMAVWQSRQPIPPPDPFDPRYITQMTYSMEDKSFFEKEMMWSVLHDRVKPLKKDIERIELEKKELLKDAMFVSAHQSNLYGIPVRLSMSLVRSCLIEDEDDAKRMYTDLRTNTLKRTSTLLVPNSFVAAAGGGRNSRFDNMAFMEQLSYAQKYLNINRFNKKDISETFLSYFCDEEELNEAKGRYMEECRNFQCTYFPEMDKNRKGNMIGGIYRFIDSRKRDLIERAVLLYKITDDEGDIDWGKVPEMMYRGVSGSEVTHMLYRFTSDDSSKVKVQ